jgi:hypothetical protein
MDPGAVDVPVKDVIYWAAGGSVTLAMWLFRRQDAALRKASDEAKQDLLRRVVTLEVGMNDAHKAIGDLNVAHSAMSTSLRNIEGGILDLKEHMEKQDTLMFETLRRVDGKVSRNTLNMLLRQFPNVKLSDEGDGKDV